MLSVLVATYNWDIRLLVKKLYTQLEKASIPFEIICIDDASVSERNIKNEQLNSYKNCSFTTLSKNIGRSSLRNLLARKATYDSLLFLDADVFPVSDKFIENYISNLDKVNVLIGGIAYKDGIDTSKLRWKLGKKREEFSADIRNKNSYKYFFTGNFLIKKEMFHHLQFDENLIKYGYEDLLFSKELEKRNIKIKHINNPVFHLGIDENTVFIEKTKQAIKNLVFLISEKKILKEDTTLTATYFKLKRFGLVFLLNKRSKKLESLAINKSSLFFLQLFRLSYLHQVLKNTN
ncbi:glycosyltransferase [Polaribacter sp. MSW13]|uniref:Glycosyltransferase n=1 Tax=Polaribacter marinus TaxID=2916838 RepID=A0A9X1VNL9_9FLAO|nr:glycosyltransferase [Polaribacter marinus]MCI2229854.1 glycosyltransferase [Polaribacter marinus]